jgi:ADP-ribose pyrophosphatase
MKREYPEHPIVGVSAVIFVDKSGLLVRRKQEPAKGQWSLPGGAVELGEGVLEALARELQEELSVKIAVGGLVGVFDKIFHDQKNQVQYHYVLVDYWGWLVEGNPSPASDVSEALLVPLDKLGGFDIDQELKDTIWKAYGAWRESLDSA